MSTPAAEAPASAVRRVTGFGAAGLDAEWLKYAGFLDLSTAEFKEVQARLLDEHIGLIKSTPLGRKLLKGRTPADVQEFRASTPLTTYGDYVGFLGDGRNEVLGAPSLIWAHTTGAQADFKWVPYTQRGYERLLDNLMGAFILAAAKKRGEVNVRPGDVVLYNTPERPYVSGFVTFGMRDRFGFRGVLDPEESEGLDFKDRIRRGFRSALGMNVDVIVSMTSVLTKVGEGFADHSRRPGVDRSMLNARTVWRLGRALVKRRLLGQAVLPKDLWPVKAIIGWGIDTSVFKGRVEHYWGKRPFELYACTEGGIMGMQNGRGLSFNPYSDFFEFIPLEDALRSKADGRFTPRTVLVDELEPGSTYEVVITNYYGMAFLRYRVGHYIRVLPPAEAPRPGAMPQFEFLGRADDRIDLAGFTRLDAKTIWDALELSGLPYRDWTARKEFEGDQALLHLYIEGTTGLDGPAVRDALHAALKRVDPFYGDLEGMLGISPLRVTLLEAGAFDRFYDVRRDGGYDVGRRTPPRMNPEEEDIRDLLAARR